MNTHFITEAHEAQATQEFEALQAECAELLCRISNGIAEHGGANLSWPSLNSVKHTRNCLIEALAGVGGLTEEEIKKYRI